MRSINHNPNQTKLIHRIILYLIVRKMRERLAFLSHPDITTRTVQSTFTIAGLSISPTTASVRMLKNRTTDIPVTVKNYGEAPLTGLRFTTEASPGITAEVINPGDTTLTAGEQAGITLRLTRDPIPGTQYLIQQTDVCDVRSGVSVAMRILR